MSSRNTLSSRNMTREKSDRVQDRITLQTMSYDEFDKFRRKYLVKYYPFNTFGKQEKQRLMQKIRKWFINCICYTEKEETPDEIRSQNFWVK
jgi:hypothetical protein